MTTLEPDCPVSQWLASRLEPLRHISGPLDRIAVQRTEAEMVRRIVIDGALATDDTMRVGQLNRALPQKKIVHALTIAVAPTARKGFPVD